MQQLVTRIQSGETRAEEELVTRFYDGLLFVVQRHTRDRDTAADITHDTLLLVLNKIRNHEIREPQKLAAFIHATGKNLCIANYRRADIARTDYNDDVLQVLEDKNQNLLTEVASTRLVNSTTQLIDELRSERDQELLRRYYLNGEEKQEICQALTLSSSHFDRVLFRARQRLKQLLAEQLKLPSDSFALSHILPLSALLLIGTGLLNSVNEKKSGFFYSSLRDLNSSAHYIINAQHTPTDRGAHVEIILREAADSWR